MKTNLSFLKNTTRIFSLAMVTLFLLSARRTTFAGSATWDSSSLLNTDWNTNGNWSPNTGYPGTGVGDTATFDNLSSTTSLFVSSSITIAAIDFTASETHAFTITVDPTITLTISGTGITNGSGITQNFVTAVDGSGNEGFIAFTNGATAGSMTSFTNNGPTVSGASGGFTQFFNTSTAGSGTFNNNGATVSGASGGFTEFFGTDATHFSTAGSATITNNAGTVSGAGGSTRFFVTSTAGSATITNNGGTVSGASGGFTRFFDTSTAGSATLIANGGTVSGASGGFTLFNNTSTAGSATLIANGGVGAGGSIFFIDTSTGGTSTVKVFNNGTGTAGNLDISAHNIGNVTIGSLEGSGNVFLGANNLTVGSNNLSKTFSGVMQDGGIFSGNTGGSLTKTGTGAFTLTGANTYTGGTTVNAGSLFVNNTGGLSGTGTGAVTVIGGTLGGGNGTTTPSVISGAVTVNSGANLAPGPTGNGSTGILDTGTFTLNSGSNFSIDLNGDVAGTGYDQVDVTGAVNLGLITGSNLVINSVSGLTVGDHLFIVENDGSDLVTGTFAGLANGMTFSSGGDTFQIFYDANGQGGGNDIELNVVATPEPSTWVSGALACAFLAYTQRRRFARMFASRVKANSVVAV